MSAKETSEQECVEIWDCFTIRCLHVTVERMAAYTDVPMDFADATLVLAAEHYSTADILTWDERGFRMFRYSRNNRFGCFCRMTDRVRGSETRLG
jgi:predicted nucleic acid-binding protein